MSNVHFPSPSYIQLTLFVVKNFNLYFQKLAYSVESGYKYEVILMISTTWIWSLVLALPPLIGWGSFKPGISDIEYGNINKKLSSSAPALFCSNL